MAVDYDSAKVLLEYCIRQDFSSIQISLPPTIVENVDILFHSKTQSYREVALGCAVIRRFDRDVDLKLPYINLGSNAYNGRTFDEKVINVFLQSHEIPCSKGPYLATFRRSVSFDSTIRNSQKDKQAYDSFLLILGYIESLNHDRQVDDFILFIVSKFIEHRDRSKIQLARIRRLHLEQQKIVLDQLLDTPSGGLIPVLVTVALLKTINICHNLSWDVNWQGINASDSASGAGGDVTVSAKSEILFVMEITERPIDGNRVVSTFNSKIVKGGISDYLFIYKTSEPDKETKNVAQRYFAQGHEINFLRINDWVFNNLATIGTECRIQFIEEFVSLLERKEVNSTLKVKWNEIIRSLSI